MNLSKGLFATGVTIVDSIKEKLNIDNIVTLKGPSFVKFTFSKNTSKEKRKSKFYYYSTTFDYKVVEFFMGY